MSEISLHCFRCSVCPSSSPSAETVAPLVHGCDLLSHRACVGESEHPFLFLDLGQTFAGMDPRSESAPACTAFIVRNPLLSRRSLLFPSVFSSIRRCI